MDAVYKSCCWFITLTAFHLSHSQLVTKQIHVCANSDDKLRLSCQESVIFIESAVIGTSGKLAPDSDVASCPSDNAKCVTRIQLPYDECNYKSSCALPVTIITQDINNDCSPTNYISIIYSCIPNNLTRSICNRFQLLDAPNTTVYLANKDFPGPIMPGYHSCGCQIKNAFVKDSPISLRALSITLYRGDGTVRTCAEQLVITDGANTTLLDTCKLRPDTEGFVKLNNLSLGESPLSTYSITFTKTIDSSSSRVESRFLLTIQGTVATSMTCGPVEIKTTTPSQPTTRSTITTQTTSAPDNSSTVNSLPNDDPNKNRGLKIGLPITAVTLVVVGIILGILINRRSWKKKGKAEPGDPQNADDVTIGEYIHTSDQDLDMDNIPYVNVNEVKPVNGLPLTREGQSISSKQYAYVDEELDIRNQLQRQLSDESNQYEYVEVNRDGFHSDYNKPGESYGHHNYQNSGDNGTKKIDRNKPNPLPGDKPKPNPKPKLNLPRQASVEYDDITNSEKHNDFNSISPEEPGSPLQYEALQPSSEECPEQSTYVAPSIYQPIDTNPSGAGLGNNPEDIELGTSDRGRGILKRDPTYENPGDDIGSGNPHVSQDMDMYVNMADSYS